ncbi:MAG TPA: hypothetical protein VM598_11025 [Bdellovibrionota bacterium]|nr:hypothetical protein [Bdellovibrionota bacterium]
MKITSTILVSGAALIIMSSSIAQGAVGGRQTAGPDIGAAISDRHVRGPAIENAIRDRHAAGPDIENAVRVRHAAGPDIDNAIRDRHFAGIAAPKTQDENAPSRPQTPVLDLNQQ